MVDIIIFLAAAELNENSRLQSSSNTELGAVDIGTYLSTDPYWTGSRLLSCPLPRCNASLAGIHAAAEVTSQPFSFHTNLLSLRSYHFWKSNMDLKDSSTHTDSASSVPYLRPAVYSIENLLSFRSRAYPLIALNLLNGTPIG